MKLDGKTVLITGASSGIGRELARQLTEKNCRLVLIARREERLQELLKTLPGKSEHVYFICDVANQEQVTAVCRKLHEDGITIDIMVLNAGVSRYFLVKDFSVEDSRYTFAVNFFGVLYFIEQLLPAMLQRNAGTIAVVSSLTGYRGMPKAASYAASKAALSNFIESLRIDLWKTGIKCVLISPGFVKSEMTGDSSSPKPFFMDTDKAVQRIIRGLENEKTEIHFPRRLSWLAKFSRLFPDKFYARLMYNKRKAE